VDLVCPEKQNIFSKNEPQGNSPKVIDYMLLIFSKQTLLSEKGLSTSMTLAESPTFDGRDRR